MYFPSFSRGVRLETRCIMPGKGAIPSQIQFVGSIVSGRYVHRANEMS